MDLSQVFVSLRSGANKLSQLNASQKNLGLLSAAFSIDKNRKSVLDANAIDVELSRQKGVSESLVDRLALDDKRIDGIIESIKIVAQSEDPIGSEIAGWKTPEGLSIRQVRVPLGVAAIIYESRPNVTADAFALAYKSGNSILLRGSSSALNSNRAIVKAIKEGLKAVKNYAIQEVKKIGPAIKASLKKGVELAKKTCNGVKNFFKSILS